jgi:hypothetical protein
MASAFSPPEGSFIMGLNAITAQAGFAGDYVNLSNYNPTPADKGGSIRAVMKRYSSNVNYAPFIGFATTADVDTAYAYILALSAENPYRIILYKGELDAATMISTAAVIDAKCLRSSDAAYASAVYHHLKLDLIYNPQGDAVLNVYEDTTDPLTPSTPTWAAVDGLESYTDDALGILSGSIPYIGSGGGYYAVYGLMTQEQGSQALFDYIEITRQTSP